MEEISKFELTHKVEGILKSGSKWHFHILTPRCMFNGRAQYAFVLENTSENKVYIHYSIEPLKDLEKELQTKLSDISSEVLVETMSLIDSEKALLDHANKLNKEGKDWHYHQLSPGCTFNEEGDKWKFIFEGEDANDIHEFTYKKKPLLLIQSVEKICPEI